MQCAVDLEVTRAGHDSAQGPPKITETPGWPRRAIIPAEEQEDDFENLIMSNWVDKDKLFRNGDVNDIAVECWLRIVSAQGSDALF
jgi:hypothetical protein